MFLKVSEVAERYRVDPATIWRWARSGRFPRPLKIEGVTRWSVKKLDAHDQALEQES